MLPYPELTVSQPVGAGSDVSIVARSTLPGAEPPSQWSVVSTTPSRASSVSLRPNAWENPPPRGAVPPCRGGSGDSRWVRRRPGRRTRATSAPAGACRCPRSRFARGPWSSRASSPKNDPGPMVATLRPCWVAVAVPLTTTKNSAPVWPSFCESLALRSLDLVDDPRNASQLMLGTRGATVPRRSAGGSSRRGLGAGRPFAELTLTPMRGGVSRRRRCPVSFAPAPRRCGGQGPVACLRRRGAVGARRSR